MRCPECQNHVMSFWDWQDLAIPGSSFFSPLWFWRARDVPGKCYKCWTRLKPNHQTRWWLLLGYVGSFVVACPIVWYMWNWDPFVPGGARLVVRLFALAVVLLFIPIYLGVLFLRWWTGSYERDAAATEAAEKMRQAIRSTPPRCLQALRTELVKVPEEYDDNPHDLMTAWKLKCPCGSSEGTVLGVMSADFEDDWLFARHLSFQCGHCRETTAFLDRCADGGEAEGARLEGRGIEETDNGEGPPRPFCCPGCGGSRGEVVVVLNYDESDVAGLEEKGGAFRCENLFNFVLVFSRCASCGQQTQVTEMEA